MSTYSMILEELSGWPRSEGVKISDLLSLSEPLRGTLNTVIREGSVPLQFFADRLQLGPEQTNTVVDLLLDHGFLKEAQTVESGEVEYRLWHAQAHRRSKGLDLWSKVSEIFEPPEP
ncbi:hypothetical protein MF271_20460 (plasmid) [Deinococcus sp. KNUC1210]|uniref:hypothetical protein n=1 Tax=Deinococcus sp. KNUC1210 TaxID=2917691 RepID=UPI001EF0EBD2|nr:hypothetical protein [Deinococcus sp. KNUC1210]ULH17777.1 hypothetical protein MF271_20460 [Deinococcus sp. KNUC1210]